MNNALIKFLGINNAKRELKRTFYQLGLNLLQSVLRATDLEINFRKLVCEDNGSGYKSTCANKETVDETRSSQERELAYELTTKGFGLSGLDWAGSGLGWRPPVGLGCV